MRALHIKLFFAVAWIAACTGCLPSEPQWLPDSSGLVYTRPENDKPTQLIHLDVENQRQRTITSLATASSPVGISADNNRIAVIETKKVAGGAEATVQVYDLAGKNLHTSAPVLVMEDTGRWNAVQWSPAADKLLLWTTPPYLYDMEAKKFEKLEGEYGPSPLFLLYQSSPFVPDGSGLLLGKSGGADDGPLVIRAWDGKLRKIDIDDKAKQPLGGPMADKKPGSPWPGNGQWKKNVWRAEIEGGYAVLDCDRNKLTFEPSDALAKLKKQGDAEHWINTVALANSNRLVIRRAKPMSEQPPFIVEFLADGEKAKVLLPIAYPGYRKTGMTGMLTYLSPNGKLVAIKYRRDEKTPPRIMVIDDTGKVVQDVEL